MSGLRRWAAGHAGTLVAALVTIAFVASGSVARCVAVHAPAEEAEPTPEELADTELPEEARALRSEYGEDAEAALDLLAANAWVDAQGTTVVRFTRRAACVRSQGGDEEWVAFAVAATGREREADGATTTTLCLEAAGWREIATLTEPVAEAAGEPAPSPTLRCPGICGGAELSLSAGLKEVTLAGPEPAVLSSRGTTLGDVRAAVAAWCADWRPTATTATWRGQVLEDHEGRMWALPYGLDDGRQTSVVVEVGMDDGKIEVREGSL